MTAASNLIADLRAEVRVDLDKFRGEIDQVKRQARTGSRDISDSFGGVKRSIEGLSGPLRAFRGALAAAGVGLGIGSAIGLGRRALETADSIDKVSQRLGVNVEALQELRFAFQLNGVEQRNFDLALQRFTRRTAEAARGTGEAKDALRELGIQLTDANGNLRPAEDLLSDVADAMQRLQSPAERVRIAFKLFDSEGVALVNTLSRGSAALDGFRQQARDTGQVIEGVAVRNLVDLKDEIDILVQAINTRAVVAIGNLAKAFNDLRDSAGLSRGAGLEEVEAELDALAQREQRLAELLRFAGNGNDASSRAVRAQLQELVEVRIELERRRRELIQGQGGGAGEEGGDGTSGSGSLTDDAKKALENQRRVLESLREERIRATGDAIELAEFEQAERLRSIQEFVKDASLAEQGRADAVATHSARIQEIQREQLENQLEEQRRVSDRFRELVNDLNRDAAQRQRELTEDLAQAAKERADQIRRFSEDMSQRILQDGRLSFRGLADAFQQEFLQRALSGLIESGLTNIGGLLRGSAAGGGGSSGLASLALAAAGFFTGGGGFAGFFADGGRIPAGRFGIAGERGPEPVFGPATVLPNSALGGGGGVVVNLITDQPSSRVEVQEAGQSGGRQVVRILVGEVAKSLARGEMDAVLRGRYRLAPRTG